MIKSNAKYTALEILTEAGFENPEKLIGKFRVVIGGISGIVKPDHVIRISPETTELEVLAGVEVKTIVIEKEAEEAEVSVGAKEVSEARGPELIAKAEHNQAVKQVARKIMEAEKNKSEFTPRGAEADLVEEATVIVEQHAKLKTK